jgi:putative ABC transport system ATP-binding protein
MMNSAISCRGLTKDFGEGETRVRVLHGLDLDVPLGGITMLAGESGCGKTTLLSVVAGLLNPTEGELTVLGENVGALAGDAAVVFRRKNLGFIFQQYNLLPTLSAAENAAVPLLAAGVEWDEAIERARAALGDLNLGHRADSRPAQLSGGQQQRVAIARALIHSPRLILCDEPTAALDGKTGHSVMEMLSAVAVKSDRAVVVVTHDHRIFDFARRIAHMEDGRIRSIEERTQPRS